MQTEKQVSESDGKLQHDYAIEIGVRHVVCDEHGNCVDSKVISVEAVEWFNDKDAAYSRQVELLRSGQWKSDAV